MTMTITTTTTITKAKALDVRKDVVTNLLIFILNENRIFCIQYELSFRGGKYLSFDPSSDQTRLTNPSKKTFQFHYFCKNLTDVTLVWGDGQHLKKHTKCFYQISGISLYSPHLSQLNMNLRANSTKKTAQASDRILYKNLTLSVETFTKSNDFVDVPIVCDDGSVILAHKVTLACFFV